MPKHSKRQTPDIPWDKERIQKQIEGVMGRIKLLNKKINQNIKDENRLRNERASMAIQISNAHKYINQLELQLQQATNNEDHA